MGRSCRRDAKDVGWRAGPDRREVGGYTAGLVERSEDGPQGRGIARFQTCHAPRRPYRRDCPSGVAGVRQTAWVRDTLWQDIPQLDRTGQRAEIVWTEEDVAASALSANILARPQLYDRLRNAALTGLRRADLVTLTWDQVSEFAITKRALKRSGGKRWQATMPRIPALGALLNELRTRPAQAR